MNRLTVDCLNTICLFLDPKALANLSAVDTSWNLLLKTAASWPPSELKPNQAVTTEDKVIGLVQNFLKDLKINQPSQFCLASQDHKNQLKGYIFCSNGGPIQTARKFTSNWQMPVERDSLSDTGSFSLSRSTPIYPLPQEPRLTMAWGQSYCINVVGSEQFTDVYTNTQRTFANVVGNSLQERFDQLKAKEERNLLQRFQEAENQERFTTDHNGSLMDLDALQAHVDQGEHLAQSEDRRPESTARCSTALKASLAFAIMGVAIARQYM